MKRSGPLRRTGSLRRRRGTSKRRCEVCEAEFYGDSRPGRGRFCSQRCMGAAQVKPRARSCSVCGSTFEHENLRRKTCSAACRNEAVRQGKIGRKNPSYNGGSRGSHEWQAAKESACRACGSGRRLVLHHVVYEQHVRKRGGNAFDPDDSLTLCWDCHAKHHHSADDRLHVRVFRPENVVFARALLGDYARDYFVRFYDGDLDSVYPREQAA